MKKVNLMAVTLMIVGLICLPEASAHYLTLNVDNYFPAVGETITISIGMGHKFPETSSYGIDKMERLYFIDPAGKENRLEMKPVGDEQLVEPIAIEFDLPGTYMIVAEKKKGFVTKTPDGYIYKAKDELKNPLKSYWSEGNAMAFVTVGKSSAVAFQKN